MKEQTKQQVEQLMQDQYNKITAIQSENARLREALEKIVKQFEAVDPRYSSDNNAIDYAKKALAQTQGQVGGIEKTEE